MEECVMKKNFKKEEPKKGSIGKEVQTNPSKQKPSEQKPSDKKC
jgi:hypothetical protein